jgi:Tol biopolymer transport system component
VSYAEYSPELAAAVDRLVPLDESLRGDWQDVVERVGQRSRRPLGLPRGRALRLALVFAAVFLLLAGVATATYYTIRVSQPPPAVMALDRAGRLRTVWRCPTSYRDCGAFVTDAALAPDGSYLAFVTDSGNSLSLYQGGIHLVDLATGTDRQLPAAPPDAATEAAQFRAWQQHYRAAARLLGCAPAHELAWSPDGSQLAYACTVMRAGNQIGRIYTIRPDGSGRRLLRTGTASAYWPTWSPDGKRIAFSTELTPVAHTSRAAGGGPRRWVWSAIYAVGLDGSHRQLVARMGAAPDWSPDGKTIAYWAPACTGLRNENGRTRLVTPNARDVTPHSRSHRCDGIGPKGSPIAAWSPDGSRLAVRAWNGLYLLEADGSHVTAVPGTDGFGNSRPVWQPPKRETK